MTRGSLIPMPIYHIPTAAAGRIPDPCFRLISRCPGGDASGYALSNFAQSRRRSTVTTTYFLGAARRLGFSIARAEMQVDVCQVAFPMPRPPRSTSQGCSYVSQPFVCL